ncbi:MAG: cellulosome anchor protein [Clostridium sp.]|nr:cellulosome anchor protein [Clostridium sp.]
MIKSNILKLCIIFALLFSLLCGCWSDTGSNDNMKPSPSVEPTNNTDSTPIQELQTIEPKNTENPIISATHTSFSPVNTPSEVKADGNIQLVMDKNTAAKGEIIKVELTVKNIPNLAAYQVNIKYDPSVLQAVNPDTGMPLANDESPKDGDILVNSSYGLIPINNHSIEEGILNFSKSYINYNKYKSDGKSEHSGVLAIIGFKVLEEKSTAIAFEDADFMSGAISGTFLFDWDGNKLTNYTVAQPSQIN